MLGYTGQKILNPTNGGFICRIIFLIVSMENCMCIMPCYHVFVHERVFACLIALSFLPSAPPGSPRLLLTCLVGQNLQATAWSGHAGHLSIDSCATEAPLNPFAHVQMGIYFVHSYFTKQPVWKPTSKALHCSVLFVFQDGATIKEFAPEKGAKRPSFRCVAHWCPLNHDTSTCAFIMSSSWH